MSKDKLVWKLILEGKKESISDDVELTFTDTSNILGEPVVSRQFLDVIIGMTQRYAHYAFFRNLKQVISDKNEDMTKKAIWALMGVVKQNSQRVGLLLGTLSEGSIHIIASWPDNFTDQLRTDSTLVDVVLNYFATNPEFWDNVDLIIGYH